MQKGRLKSPQKSLILENQAFWGSFWPFWPKRHHFGYFGQPFANQGGHAGKKMQLRLCLNQQDRATFEFSGNYTHRKPGKKKSNGGALREARGTDSPG